MRGQERYTLRRLREKLDEEERTATNHGKLKGDTWTAVQMTDSCWEVVGVGRTIASHLSEWEARHIADHDPARAVREVEVKRRLAEAITNSGPTSMSEFSLVRMVLRLLSAGAGV